MTIPESDKPSGANRANLIAKPQPSLPRWTRILPIAILALYLFVLLGRFAYKDALFLTFFDDDYFYYLVVAKNIVLHGTSTFNGIQITNGYHPLWLLINTLLYSIFGDHKSFFVVLILLVWLLVCGAYRALRRTQNSLHIATAYGLPCLVFSLTFMAVICRTAMEISLTLFFLALLWQRMAAQPLEEQTPRSAILSGLVASGAVLGRLDANLIVIVYAALMLYKPATTRKAALRSLLYFGIGLLPIAAYLAINHHVFGALLPISGFAKNLKGTFIPSDSTLRSLLEKRAINATLVWPACALGLLFILHLIRRPRDRDSVNIGGQRVQLCVLLHPLLFYTILSFTSDWQIWSWYFYPLVPIAAILGPPVLADWKFFQSQTALRIATAGVACLALFTLIGSLRINSVNLLLLQQAEELRTFSNAHPGVYSMGGGAGFPAYLMSSPVVQLEGLMGDVPFLERVKQKQPLVQALNELHVDYYITMLLADNYDPNNPCYDVREPEKAGHQSPVMAAHICTKPVADFDHSDPVSPHHLLVFDVHTLVSPAEVAAEERR